MTLAAANKSLEGPILDSGPANVPVGLPDHEFDVVAPSIQMYIRDGVADIASLGAPASNLVRYTGVVIFTIFTEGGKGRAEAAGYAETIKTAYLNKQLGEVVTKAPYPQDREQDGNFYSMNVVVPFHRDTYEA